MTLYKTIYHGWSKINSHNPYYTDYFGLINICD
jgi:hypothetical protein